MNDLHRFMDGRLAQRQQQGNYRQLQINDQLVDFCSNDYLGFARSARLRDDIKAEVETHSAHLNGSTGSRLISGNTLYGEALEETIARHHVAEAALLFHSGYDANLALFSALPQKGDTIIHDALIHASIIDGARLSPAKRYSFRHNDVADLEIKLRHATGRCYVAVESIYSMDGDLAPLTAIAQLCEMFGAALIVDEAHAVGLYPRGVVCSQGMEEKIFARVITFGKALGVQGAAIVGGTLLREYLINFARPFIYSTAPSFTQLAAIKMAYLMLVNSAEEVNRLKQNIQLYRHDHLAESPIQSILFGSNARARNASEICRDAGYNVLPILSPTVPAGTERLRLCIHSFNTSAQITALRQVLAPLRQG